MYPNGVHDWEGVNLMFLTWNKWGWRRVVNGIYGLSQWKLVTWVAERTSEQLKLQSTFGKQSSIAHKKKMGNAVLAPLKWPAVSLYLTENILEILTKLVYDKPEIAKS